MKWLYVHVIFLVSLILRTLFPSKWWWSQWLVRDTELPEGIIKTLYSTAGVFFFFPFLLFLFVFLFFTSFIQYSFPHFMCLWCHWCSFISSFFIIRKMKLPFVKDIFIPLLSESSLISPHPLLIKKNLQILLFFFFFVWQYNRWRGKKW